MERAFPESSAWDRPGFLLWHATLAWQRQVGDALRPLGLTHVQFVLLAGTFWLEVHGDGPPSQRTLADHAGTDVMMTSQVIRSLQARKLIRRTDDPRDSRAYALLPSAAGRKLARAAAFAMKEANDDFFETVGGDSGRLRTMLAQLTSENWAEADSSASAA